jgi:hypothetical protein
MTHTAIIYEEAGADPAIDRIATRHGDHATTIVATGDGSPAGVAKLAAELVGEGADVVELCGGMGPDVAARILEATGGEVPVGLVSVAPPASGPR